MPYRYDFVDESHVLLVVFFGEISAAEELAAVEEVVADPRMRQDARILVDKTKASMFVTPDDVGPQIELVRRHLETFGRPRVANVVGSAHDFGMTRMLEIRAEPVLPHDFGVFSGVQEACAWLGVDHDSVKARIEELRRAAAEGPSPKASGVE